MRRKILKYRLPNYLAGYLINGDPSGLEDTEINEIDAFLKAHKVSIISMQEDSNFYYSNDLNNMGADCSTFEGFRIPQNRTINKIITNVSSKYGAPMGRSNVGTKPTDKKIYDCAVPMVSTGEYDRGGAYWGLGKQLRVQYTKDLTYIHFYRLGEL
ncbi:MAG TPA: DUF6926 domain-containing protein [Candidatus Wunengus sp. YC60]|uniref:DUF6926 domain-containing protein n=1 Tax=Candidatus Wunengus sp. YC60 TaxID=3367697 RepID=UPI0040280950